MAHIDLSDTLAEMLASGTPTGSGMAAIISRGEEVLAAGAAGTVRSMATAAEPLTESQPRVTLHTRWDLASLTKPFVAAALLAELEERGLPVTTELAGFLPEFRQLPQPPQPPSSSAAADRPLQLADLLTHTAGFPPSWLTPAGQGAQAVREFRRTARPVAPRGTLTYSCVGFIWLGLLLQELTGESLTEVIARRFPREPFATLGYMPQPTDRPHIVATEWHPADGMLQGRVHDDTCRLLGGVSGNAGLFGSAWDVWHFVRALAGEGGVLSPAVRELLLTPVPGVRAESGFGHTLGLRVDENWCAALRGWLPGAAAPARGAAFAAGPADVAGDCVVSHTGFTGTAWALQPSTGVSLVLLTNRVHPTREVPLVRVEIVPRLLAAVGR